MKIYEYVAVPFEYISEGILELLEGVTPIFARSRGYGELTDPCSLTVVIGLEVGTVHMFPVPTAHHNSP